MNEFSAGKRPINPSSEAIDAVEAAWAEAEQVLASPVETADGLGAPLPSEPVRPVTNPLEMVETAFLASAGSLVWLIDYYFPMGPVLRILFSLPIALIALRWGRRAAWMGALVAGLLLSVLMGPMRSILYVMPYALMGVLLGTLWRRGTPWNISIPVAASLGVLGFFFRIWLVSLLLGDNLWLYATAQVTDLLEWIFVRLGLLIQPSLGVIQTMVVVTTIAGNTFYQFVVHLLALLLFDRIGNPIPRPPKWVEALVEYEEP
jgi:uncharacterized protein YybS (DUF2232 family)